VTYHLGPIDPDRHTELFADAGDGEPQRRPRRVLATVLTLLVMGLFSGGLWFAYVHQVRHAGGEATNGDVPLIRADERPTKVKPDQPGGMEVPDRDKLIYNPTRTVVEHLLPPPEKPMARPTPPPAQTEAARPPTGSMPSEAGRPENPPSTTQIAQPQAPGKAAAGAPLPSKRGCGPPGMGTHQTQEQRSARQPLGDPGPRRSWRQGNLLSHRNGTSRGPGCRRADLQRTETAQHRVHHCPMKRRPRLRRHPAQLFWAAPVNS